MGIYFMIITAYFLILFNIFGYYTSHGHNQIYLLKRLKFGNYLPCD